MKTADAKLVDLKKRKNTTLLLSIHESDIKKEEKEKWPKGWNDARFQKKKSGAIHKKMLATDLID